MADAIGCRVDGSKSGDSVTRCLRCALRKLLDLRRHDRKATPLFANPRSFDRCVERQKIGLRSHFADK